MEPKGPFTREERTLKPWDALLEWGDPEKVKWTPDLGPWIAEVKV
jgi:hypothetical protein